MGIVVCVFVQVERWRGGGGTEIGITATIWAAAWKGRRPKGAESVKEELHSARVSEHEMCEPELLLTNTPVFPSYLGLD